MLKSGSKVGRWEVLHEGEPYINPTSSGRSKRFVCKCACGKEKLVRESTLLSGDSKSCGCYAAETASARSKTHGLSKHVLYNVWHDMLRRCTNPSRKDYKHYGGRGISVYDAWQGENGVSKFIEDMYPSYVDGLELERVDVNGNYCPENCTWVTRQTQVINRRPMNNGFDAHFLTFQGKTLCISQWGTETGIPKSIITDRVNKLGWNIEDALTVKIRIKRTFVIVSGLKFLIKDVFRNPPNMYRRAEVVGVSATQYIADMLYGKADVYAEIGGEAHKIESQTDRSNFNTNWLKEGFLGVFKEVK